MLGIAQTGTGKTAAFVLPMLTLLEQGRARARMPRTLILEPTRELAAQVEESFEKYGSNHKLTMALLIGGVSFDDQDKKLDRGVDVLIATPGRLLDHFERGKLLLTGVEILVIDEADRMLDMGFIPDIERICKLLPFTRQTLFFSATMPPEIQRLTDNFLHNPVRVEVSPPATAAVDHQRSRSAASGREPADKREVLRELIRGADRLQERHHLLQPQARRGDPLQVAVKHGFNAGALHGDMDQRARMATLDAFREGEIKLLVASRRRGARPRHPRCQPHLQFRRADPLRGLRPPHRPHRPRRPERDRDHHRDADRPEIRRADRGAGEKADPAD